MKYLLKNISLKLKIILVYLFFIFLHIGIIEIYRELHLDGIIMSIVIGSVQATAMCFILFINKDGRIKG